MRTFKDLLIELDACDEAKEWAGDKAIEEIVKECHRGDWLLWLSKKIGIHIKPLTLAKGLCANTVRHLMKDERSISAVDIAIAFGRGEIGKTELKASCAAAAAAAANAAADAAYAAAANAAAAAANAAADAANDTAAAYAAAYAAYNAADAADAADAAAAAYSAAKKENQLQTANICREILGQLIIKKVNQLLK